MIKEAYCSFEVSKLLKEKGFNETCNRVYEGPNLKYTTLHISPLMSLGEFGGFHPKKLYVTNNELGDIVYTAPTHQMAIAWLREEKYVLIFIVPAKDENSNLTYCADVWTWNDDEGIYEPTWAYANYIYEDAVEAALKYVLKNLI